MLRRKAYDSLVAWKNREGHKSLLISGPRRCGKTYVVDRFAKDHYENYVRADLSANPGMRRVFDGDLAVDSVIQGLLMYLDGARFVPGSTLIFLDGVQDCPRARTALKQFTIDGRYDVIASDSFAGAAVLRAPSGKRWAERDDPLPPLPVGYEENIAMTSMDFEEFLWAVGFPEEVIERVRGRIKVCEPIGEPALSALMSRFRDFQIVGGMPEAVSAFLDGGYSEAARVQREILFAFFDDIVTYNAPADAMRTAACLRSLPSQLSDGNKKFTYSRMDDGSSRQSADKYRGNLLWIKAAGYGNFCHAVISPESPLRAMVLPDAFKMYMSDTGLLTNMLGIEARRAIYEGDTGFGMGAVTENVVAECLMKCGYPPLYYRKTNGRNKMELDFVLETEDGIAAVEVRSGKRREAPSIRKAGEAFRLGRRLVLENGDIGRDDDGIEHYPLFASAFMNEIEPEWDGPELRGTKKNDLVVEHRGTPVPVEVMAAMDLRSKRLRAFRDRYGTEVCVRKSLDGTMDWGWLVDVPLYTISSIGRALDGRIPPSD